MKDLKEQAKEYFKTVIIPKNYDWWEHTDVIDFANQVTEELQKEVEGLQKFIMVSATLKNLKELQEENTKLKDKLSNSIRWAEEERKGRERMRRLYAEKLEENTKLKEGVKKYLDWMYDEDLIKLKELLNESK